MVKVPKDTSVLEASGSPSSLINLSVVVKRGTTCMVEIVSKDGSLPAPSIHEKKGFGVGWAESIDAAGLPVEACCEPVCRAAHEPRN